MSRVKKILIVSLVLAVGVGLAWPYRKSAPMFVPEKQIEMPTEAVSGSVTFTKPPVAAALGDVNPTPLDRHVVAKMASTADSAPTTPTPTGFDLENHAALVNQPSAGPSPTTPTLEQPPATPKVKVGETRTARPAYSTSRQDTADDAAWPDEVVHVVSNGDTLEKLAQRYLGDSGRAMELFDLNRDQLANPHLLPIGAELRIPIPPRRESD